MLHGKTYGTCVLWQEFWAKTATDNDVDDDDALNMRRTRIVANEFPKAH